MNDRKISPKFPTMAEANERRRRKQENVIACGLVILTLVSFVLAVWQNTFWYLLYAAIFFGGFLGVCFAAGLRHNAENHGGGL